MAVATYGGVGFFELFAGYRLTLLHIFVFLCVLRGPMWIAMGAGLAMAACSVARTHWVQHDELTFAKTSLLIVPHAMTPVFYLLALRVAAPLDSSRWYAVLVAAFFGTLLHTAIFLGWSFATILLMGSSLGSADGEFLSTADLVRLQSLHFPIEAAAAMLAGAIYLILPRIVSSIKSFPSTTTQSKSVQGAAMEIEKSRPQQDDRFAVLIGIGDDLPCTIKDAEGIYAQLLDQSRCGFKMGNVRLLIEPDATKARILEELKWLRSRLEANPEAVFVVYYSGHGGRTKSGNYYLVPNGFDPANVAETALGRKDFVGAVGELSGRRGLVLLDCCFATAFTKGRSGGVKPGGPPLAMLKELTKGSGRAVISSCGIDEVSFAGTPYSEFTKAFLEGLAGYGTRRLNGVAQLLDVLAWIREQVPKRTDGRQNPTMSYDATLDFPLAYYAGSETSPKRLNWSDADPDWPDHGDVRRKDDHGDLLELLAQLLPGEFDIILARLSVNASKLHGSQEAMAAQLFRIMKDDRRLDDLAKAVQAAKRGRGNP